MAFGITFEIRGMTPEQYARLAPRLNEMAKGQPGFLVHISGPIEGGYRVTEVWESEEEQKRFSGEYVAPLFMEEGVPPASVSTFPVENIVMR